MAVHTALILAVSSPLAMNGSGRWKERGVGTRACDGIASTRGIDVAHTRAMLKLLGSYALAKLLGFGIIGAIVIYALLSLVS